MIINISRQLASEIRNYVDRCINWEFQDFYQEVIDKELEPVSFLTVPTTLYIWIFNLIL